MENHPNNDQENPPLSGELEGAVPPSGARGLEIELRSEEVQEILTKVPHWMIRWGNVLFLSLIVLLLIMSWFVKYPDIITSKAIITTQIPPQKEFAKITGKLDTILVKDNDTVTENQPLAILETPQRIKMYYYYNLLSIP